MAHWYGPTEKSAYDAIWITSNCDVDGGTITFVIVVYRETWRDFLRISPEDQALSAHDVYEQMQGFWDALADGFATRFAPFRERLSHSQPIEHRITDPSLLASFFEEFEKSGKVRWAHQRLEHMTAYERRLAEMNKG